MGIPRLGGEAAPRVLPGQLPLVPGARVAGGGDDEQTLVLQVLGGVDYDLRGGLELHAAQVQYHMV